MGCGHVEDEEFAPRDTVAHEIRSVLEAKQRLGAELAVRCRLYLNRRRYRRSQWLSLLCVCAAACEGCGRRHQRGTGRCAAVCHCDARPRSACASVRQRYCRPDCCSCPGCALHCDGGEFATAAALSTITLSLSFHKRSKKPLSCKSLNSRIVCMLSRHPQALRQYKDKKEVWLRAPRMRGHAANPVTVCGVCVGVLCAGAASRRALLAEQRLAAGAGCAHRIPPRRARGPGRRSGATAACGAASVVWRCVLRRCC